MATKIKHAYAVDDRVTLISGRVVLITKLRKTPGADVVFAPIRNQPWYEGNDADGVTHTFPQTSVVQRVEDDYPKVVPNRTPRVLAARAARKRLRAKESFLIEWPLIDDTEDEFRAAGERITGILLNQAPSGVSTEVFHGLLEFATSPDSKDLGLLPLELQVSLRRFLKKVRANQAALR